MHAPLGASGIDPEFEHSHRSSSWLAGLGAIVFKGDGAWAVVDVAAHLENYLIELDHFPEGVRKKLDQWPWPKHLPTYLG